MPRFSQNMFEEFWQQGSLLAYGLSAVQAKHIEQSTVSAHNANPMCLQWCSGYM